MHPRISTVLTTNNISFSHCKEGDEVMPLSTEVLAARMGCRPEQVTKTLFMQPTSKSKRGTYCLVVASRDKRLDLVRAAVAHQVKLARLSMAPEADIKSQLDYPKESVSPLACGGIDVIIDQELMGYRIIWVGAGAVGEHVGLAPSVIVEMTGAKVVDLTKQPPDPDAFDGEPGRRG